MSRAISAQGAYCKREFVPGYAAHVPQINQLFGMPTGKMVKLVTREDGIKSFNMGATVYDDGNVKRVKIDRKANKVPGYSGHLTGVKAENLFGQTFFKSFKKSLRFKVK